MVRMRKRVVITGLTQLYVALYEDLPGDLLWTEQEVEKDLS